MTEKSGNLEAPGQGETTGQQKSRPVAKKETYSTTCQAFACNARLNIAGTCQTTSAAAAASQQKAGWASVFASRRTAVHANIGLMSDCTNCRGRPWNHASSGSPSQISGGASVMSRTC